MSDNNSPNPNSASTPHSKKAEILGALWISYKQHPSFKDYIEYNDLGLPLAYAVATDVIEASPKATMFIDESWNILLEGLGLEDTGFEDIDDLLGSVTISDADFGLGGFITDK